MGLTPRRALLRPANWIAPVLLVAGVIALSLAGMRPAGERGPFVSGLLYPVLRYDGALMLAGLGFALAQTRGRGLILNGAIFAAGLPLGGLAGGWIAAALAAGGDIIRYVLLIVPGCCVITGAALVAPRGGREWILPVAALATGMALGLVINFDDAMAEEWLFAGGAVLAGTWIVVTALLLWRRFERQWFPIAGRILGAWLMAIGLMLGAFHLIPPPG